MHEEEYKGRIITAEAVKCGNNWTWSYQIDGGPMRQGKDRPLPREQLVLKEAIREAKTEIDNTCRL